MRKPKLPHQQAVKYSAIISSPIGKLGLVVVGDVATRVDYVASSARLKNSNDKAVCYFVSKIKDYFRDPNTKFDSISAISGATDFQLRVWRMLQQIPLGSNVTYGKLARSIGTSPRAIGNACRSNPLPIIVPCHRVIGANGLGGYCGKISGKNVRVKKWLLEHEGKLL